MISIPLLAATILVAGLSPPATIDLAGPWKFRTGDDLAWAAPALDDAGWSEISIPTGWGRDSVEATMTWYRRELVVDPRAAREPPGLAIQLGKVDSAYELYAGGRRLGGVGALPPSPRIDYDRHCTYVLPPDAVEDDGRIVLALRVWKSPESESAVGGPVEGEFRIGPVLPLVQQAVVEDTIQVSFAAVFGLVALIHLWLYLRRRPQRVYLWYGLLAFDAGLYVLLRTQAKYALVDSFRLLKELEYVSLLIWPALFVEFVWTLVERPVPRALRALQVGWIALAAAGALPGLWFNTHTLVFWELSLLPAIVAIFATLLGAARRGNVEARNVAIGLAVFAVLAGNDIAVDRGWLIAPRVTAYGFATLVIAMALCLADRFTRLQAALAGLTHELEERVAERTAQLERLAATDPLTGLHNRRSIQRIAGVELARLARQGQRLSVVVLDVDSFKMVNDTWGHEAGDAVLAALGHRLAAAIRAHDALGRHGGEEFVILLPGLDEAEALAAAERLRELVASEPIALPEGPSVRLSASFGVAVVARDEPFEDALRRADRALYAAKGSGRNRVVAAAPTLLGAPPATA